MDFTIDGGVRVTLSDKESDAVKIAAENLKTDIGDVFGHNGRCGAEIIIGTIGVSDCAANAVDLDALKDDSGTLRKEAYFIAVKDGVLYLGGTDRRGTIYAIYEFCEFIGVSPWYFFADVPKKKKDSLRLPEGYLKTDYPTVEYRGIFINDEEELERWAQSYMHEETIGVKTYEKIFELVLRLKGNYIWPAMHVNSFNVKRENGELANRMGIVVGTSHCDMLMRSNNREWYPWLEKKGYKNVEYDYSIEGENRDKLREYWRESIVQNKDFEVSYTLGMRGIHDSGFEVSAFEGYKGEELTRKKIELLERIVSDQERMLSEELDEEPLKIFVPYKEVLNLYDAGLEVPEDLTLIWSNDNYGHIRRYPGKKERNRRGGNGIYYHNSYWAPACASYLFICSIPLAHTKNELKKAYTEGIRKLWVLNVGALKPIEPETEFFLRYAWEIGKETTTADIDGYIEQWYNKTFSGGSGKECADIVCEFDAIINSRKVEFMDNGVFGLNEYGNEYAERVNRLSCLVKRTRALADALPEDEKDAFTELVGMKIEAGFYINAQYYYADCSRYCNRRGMMNAAKTYTELSHKYDDRRRELIMHYNLRVADGKWNGILLPETFPPPVTAMHPACMPPIKRDKHSHMIVNIYNDDKDMVFVDDNAKWIEIAPSGKSGVTFSIDAPDWLELSQKRGYVPILERIMIKPLQFGRRGKITVHGTDETFELDVSSVSVQGENVEDCGMVSLDASAASARRGWREIKRLGRGGGSLMESECAGAEIEYKFTVVKGGNVTVELHRFPSLNSTGEISAVIGLDGAKRKVVSDANDEYTGHWKDNILNEVDRLWADFGRLEPGEHTLTITAADKYFAFSRCVVYFGEIKRNNGGKVYKGEMQRLPMILPDIYSGFNLKPRPQVFGVPNPPENTLLCSTRIIQEEQFAESRDIYDLIRGGGKGKFRERGGFVKIDAAAALAETEFAHTSGDFTYCDSTSYGCSSVALYVDGNIMRYKKEPEKAPYLEYAADTDGGEYTIWILTKEPRDDAPYVSISIDNEYIPPERLTGKGKLWRYETEQIWHWTPLYKTALAKGCHVLRIHSLTTGIKFDRICLVKGDSLPPTDCVWTVDNAE